MRFPYFILILLCIWSCNQDSEKEVQAKPDFAIVIHGGAGYITAERIDSVSAEAYRDTLNLALQAGYDILANGGSALDAVELTLSILEDCTLFNAGRGSVYNHKAQQEMDASIMDGNTLNTGAVAGVRYIKNPIKAARLVMDSSKHVMLAGRGAEQLAVQYGMQMEDSSYFYDADGYSAIQKKLKQDKHGTVGAVALDKNGNLAAATSTGGMFNKKWNRIGDSPIIGAGTYANNNSCAISCTGTGEYYIRTVAAHEVSSLMLYKNISLDFAIHQVIFNQIEPLGGEGGMIGIDRNGAIAWDFNTPGMFRAYKTPEETQVFLFGH
ncbi:MAG: isoaspartyl peptidase/L-asparaginase [Bacteroidia bacterium]